MLNPQLLYLTQFGNIDKIKKLLRKQELFYFVVGVAGFEPTTSWSQTKRDTGLRYTPIRYHLLFSVLQI